MPVPWTSTISKSCPASYGSGSRIPTLLRDLAVRSGTRLSGDARARGLRYTASCSPAIRLLPCHLHVSLIGTPRISPSTLCTDYKL